MAIAACVEKKKINNLRAGEGELDITGNHPSPQTPIPFSISAKQPVCGRRSSTDRSLQPKKNSSASAHQKGKQRERSRTEAVVRRGNGEGGSGRGISLFRLFSGFEYAPKLRKPWLGCSLTPLFSI